MTADIHQFPKRKTVRSNDLALLAGGLADMFREDRSHISPCLDREIASRLNFAASLLNGLAADCKSLKRPHEVISLLNMAEICETRAAMILAEIGDHDEA